MCKGINIMNVTVKQSDLRKAIMLVSHAVSTKSTMPILSCIQLVGRGDKLMLEATDLEMAIKFSIPCTVIRAGTAAVPAKLFHDLITNLPNDIVTIEVNEETHSVNIQCGKFKNDILGMSAQDYPYLPDVSEGKTIADISVGELKESLQQCVVAAASDNSRPVLAGVFFQFPEVSDDMSEPEKLKFKMCAADGFRLAIRTLSMAQRYFNEKQSMIVPAMALNNLIRMLSYADKTVSLASNSNQLFFSMQTTDGDAVLIVRLIDGNYPDIARVIPATGSTKVIVTKTDFSKSVKVAKLFAVSSNNIVRFKMDPLTGITITANGDGKGSNNSVVDAEINGNEIEIALNVSFVEDALNTIDTDKVIIEINSSQQPAVFSPDEIVDYKHIIMPMMVR